jgi:hypothetical protein
MRITRVPQVLPGGGRRTDGGNGEDVNQAVVGGVIIAEPRREEDGTGAFITVLLVSLAAPDGQPAISTYCEVEIADSVAGRHHRWLHSGRRVRVEGYLTGAGIWATSLGIP